MKQTLLKLLQFLMHKFLKPGIILPLVFLVCNEQASAVCNVSASFKFKDSGGTFYFTNLSTGNINRTIWYFGDGYASGSTNTSHRYKQDTSGYFCVMLRVWDTTQSNCWDTAIRCVYVVGCPAKASYSHSVSNLTATFQNTSKTGLKYKWTFGDGSTSTSRSPSHTYGSFGNYSVKLLTIDTTQGNCRDSITKSVSIGTCPTNPNFYFSTFGYTATFAPITTVGTNKYKWYFGDGNTSTARNPMHTYSTVVKGYYVKFVISDSTNSYCKDSSTEWVDITGCMANASFTVKDSNGVHYFINTTTGANQYQWGFGDGSYSTLANPTHVYIGNPRNVIIGLKAWNTAISNCYDSFGISTYIYTTCNSNPNFSYQVSGMNAGFTSGTIAGRNKFKWYFGDGTTSTTKNPTHTYSSTGTYSVKLVVTDTMNGSCRDSLTRSVVVINCLANANFTSRDSAGKTYFMNTSTGANSYAWNFGDGGTSTATNPVHTYSSKKTYLVRLIVKNTAITGCADTTSIYITTCTVTSNFSVYQKQGLKVTFNNYSNSAHKYLWKFGNGQTSTVKYPVHTYSAAGTYTVKLITWDTVKYCSDSMSLNVTISACYVSGDFSYKDSGGLFYFTDKSTGANKNKWLINYQPVSTAQSFSYRFSGAARNIVVMLVLWDTSQSNCTDTVYKQIYYPGCSAYYTIEPDSTNQYSALIVDRSRTGSNASYIWDFGDGDTSHSKTPSHVYSGAGTYKLCLTVWETGCSKTFCDTLTFDSSGNLVSLSLPFTIRVIIPGEQIENTSLEEMDYSGYLKLYPNPGYSVIHIESGVWGLKQVGIVDALGKTLVTHDTSEMKVNLNLEHLSPGLYFIEVRFDNDKIKRIKFIKN